MLHIEGDTKSEHLFMSYILQMDPNLPVLAPGDKEKSAAAKSDETGTISFVPQQIESCLAIAKKLKVKPMECLVE